MGLARSAPQAGCVATQAQLETSDHFARATISRKGLFGGRPLSAISLLPICIPLRRQSRRQSPLDTQEAVLLQVRYGVAQRGFDLLVRPERVARASDVIPARYSALSQREIRFARNLHRALAGLALSRLACQVSRTAKRRRLRQPRWKKTRCARARASRAETPALSVFSQPRAIHGFDNAPRFIARLSVSTTGRPGAAPCPFSLR